MFDGVGVSGLWEMVSTPDGCLVAYYSAPYGIFNEIRGQLGSLKFNNITNLRRLKDFV